MQIDLAKLPPLSGDETKQALLARALVLEATAQDLAVGAYFDPMAGEWVALMAQDLTLWDTAEGSTAETMDLAIIAAAEAAGLTLEGWTQ